MSVLPPSLLPHVPPLDNEALLSLAISIAGRRVFVLTGAGVSTESGIPDYRGPITSKTPHRPMTFAMFRDHAHQRRRYWARATAGWPSIRDAMPNAAHRALAELQRCSRILGVVTQNVDALHQRAGSRDVVELHGGLARVRCLACDEVSARNDLHARLLEANPVIIASDVAARPDGDVALRPDGEAGFVVVDCESCGGVLKPDVVMFGENVRKEDLEAAWSLYDAADTVLVVGSSLHVYSGRRFIIRAARDRKSVVAVNLGVVRDAHLLQLHIDARAGDVLPRLLRSPKDSP